ncbi:MAG: hypothetical protein ABEH38_09825 [Flavobacteriales bacterium]
MKDPYTPSNDSDQTNGPQDPEEGISSTEAPLKAPSRASVQKVLDFSRAYEVLDKGDGSAPYDLIRN